MSKTTLGFLFSGLIYLSLGIALGILFFVLPQTRALRTVHAHLNLVGFVTFAIFGIGYHILPRFRGKPLYSENLAWWQFWLANTGLAGLLLFLTLATYGTGGNFIIAQAVFSGILALSFYMFVYNMFRTLLGK